MRLFRHFTSFRERQPALVVPPKFNRNSRNVTSLMTPEESGYWLLERMRQRIGFDSYAEKKLLDFGCGVRFSQAIINRKVSVGRYVGVDNYYPLIKFLWRKVRDDRFEYVFFDVHHAIYNPGGIKLSTDSILPVAMNEFDVVCMFSVITHQDPNQSQNILSILRRHVALDGHLFFTCFLDNSIATFEDRSPERNGGRCFYNPTFLTQLVESCGWRLVNQAPSEGPIIGDSFVFRGV